MNVDGEESEVCWQAMNDWTVPQFHPTSSLSCCPRLLGGHQSTLMKRSLKEQRPLLQAEHQCNVSNRWFVWMSLDVRDLLVFSSSLWNVCVRLWSKKIWSFMCADTQEEEAWAHFFSKSGAFTLRAKCTAVGRCTVSSCLDLTTNN